MGGAMGDLFTLNAILRFSHPPGDYVPINKHSGVELVFYRYGTGTTIIDGVLYEYSDNSLAVIPPNTNHDETTVTPSEVLFCIFQGGGEIEELKSSFYQDKGSVTEDIYGLLCQIETEIRLKQIYYEERIDLILHEILIILRRLENQDTDNHGIVDYVKRLLKENTRNYNDFHIIAESIGYSYDRFRHLFREQTGISPSQYLMNLRIASAKQLLEDETIPLSRVGMLCGFQNTSNFVTMFHKKTRITPMQYRKMALQNTKRDVLNLTGKDDEKNAVDG